MGKALKLLHSALNAFVSRMLQKVFGDSWIERVMDCLQQPQPMAFMTTAFGHVPKEIATNGVAGNESGSRAQELDLRNLLQCITRMWDVFRMVLKPVVRSLCFELVGVRNSWAHQERFTADDTYRALDTMERVMSAIGAIEEMRIVKQERQGYVVYMATGLRDQGIVALPVKEQPPLTSWCDSREHRSSSSSSRTLQSSINSNGAHSAESEMEMEWEF